MTVSAGDLIFTTGAESDGGTATLAGGTTLTMTSAPFKVEGGKFIGSGTVQGDLQVDGGDVYPGDDKAVGTLVVTSNYTQTGGTLHIDVDGKTKTADMLQVGNPTPIGSVTLQ